MLRWLLAPRGSAETGEWDTEGDALRRELTSHANDGVISSAAILQGLLSAGATGREAVIGVAALMTVGVLTSAGTAFGETSAERRSQLAIVADEQRRLALAPEEELEELVEHYRAKGLSEELSRAVAQELHAKDALAAQLDSEFDLDAPATAWWPVRMAAYAGVAPSWAVCSRCSWASCCRPAGSAR
ncbi:VIT1/CCC1 transporter family protein [Miniimonas sp. S16]|uniref:VIT1/CCC1 transporter family protein n=1 Tax=Miniimonas sp. S16 TaxID=2171623 RepID=UPI00131EEE4F|nr:VIT1/CCC1 transporter family protein [Miniimonas sp. S16]